MTTTLSEGVKVPDVGSVNWAGDLEVNWNLLNGALANLSGNVKLDRDNIWTGEQSFTLPIVGSITGTASKAIADEDGTSIKTGYVNVAGNQTVSGKKTWTQAQVFQNNVYLANTSYTVGTIPTSNITSTCFFVGASIYQIGYCRSVVYKTTGQTSAELTARNKFTNEALDPNGDYTNATFTVNLDADGTRWIQFANSSIKNGLTPYTTDTYNIGNATNQWLRMFAKFYYYNGVAWGLDQDNVWTGVNDFNNLIRLNNAELWFKHPNIEDITTNPSTDVGKSILQIWNKGTTQYFGGIIDHLTTDGSHELELVCFGYPLNDTTPYQHRFRFAAHRNGGADFYPTYNGVVNLGTSSNKWKTLNGINPGALSLPSSSYVEIDTTNWDKTGATSQSYTPVVHGWLYISIQNIAGNYLSMSGGRGALSMDGTGVQSGLRAMLPVIANESVSITVKTGSIFAARFYPMLGNV